jgi:YidC/Oxa1 family membrane protein insertase
MALMTPSSSPESDLGVDLTSSAPPIAEHSALEIEQIPEGIGYLKELGLDFGWGPSSFMEFIIEHIHIYSGLPWWTSIVCAGILVRIALFKFTLSATNISAKLAQLRPTTDPLRTRLYQLAREGNQLEMLKVRAQLSDINQKHDIKVWKSFVPLLQIPLGYGCFRVVRGMAALPVPAVAREHALWLNDLTIADPWFILPAVQSIFLYLSMKVWSIPPPMSQISY